MYLFISKYIFIYKCDKKFESKYLAIMDFIFKNMRLSI